MDHSDIVTVIERDYNAQNEQRDRSNEDQRFCDVDGAQYDDWYGRQFANRPKFEFNLIYQAVYKFVGEFQESRVSAKFSPAMDKATEDDAELLNGLFRRDFYRDNRGIEASDQAVTELAKAGVGAFRLGTEYMDDEDMESDEQRIFVDPIYNAYNSVIWDSNAKLSDKSDAKHVTYLEGMERHAAEEKYGEDVSSAFTPNDRRRFTWNSGNMVWIAHFYECHEKKDVAIRFESPLGRKMCLYKDQVKDNLDELLDGGFVEVSRKKVKRKQVFKTVVGGAGVIEERRRIAGKMLPIIPFYGYRTYVDGEEYYFGITRKYKDANRLYNMAASSIGEAAATTQKDMPIFTGDQVEGREKQLSEMHLGEYNYAVINPVIDEATGNSSPIGPVGQWNASRVDPNNAAVVDLAQNFIQNGTGSNPTQIEEAQVSGVAVDKLKQILDANTIILRENIKKGFIRAGLVYQSMAEEVYDSPRTEYIQNVDGTDRAVQLYKPAMNEKTGEPEYQNTLSGKKFLCSVDAGASYRTQRRESLEALKEIAQLAKDAGMGEYLQFIFAEMIELVDGAGLQDLKEFNRFKMLVSGMRKPESDEDKAILEQQAANRDESQQRLMNAMEQQAIGEAMNSQASAVEKQTKARLNIVKAAEIEAGIDTSRYQAVTDRMKAIEQSSRRAVIG